MTQEQYSIQTFVANNQNRKMEAEKKSLRSDSKTNFLCEAYAIKPSEVRMTKLTQEAIIEVKLELQNRSKSRTKRPAHRRVPIAIVEVEVLTTSCKNFFIN